MIGLSCGMMKMKIILNIYKGAAWLLFYLTQYKIIDIIEKEKYYDKRKEILD